MDLVLEQRIENLSTRASFLQGKRDTIQIKATDLEALVLKLESDSNDLGKVLKVLGKLVDNMVKKDLDAINHLVNYGLKVVFPDRDLEFKSGMVEVGGKMQINFETYDSGKLADSDTHGSVSVIESLILRVICIAKTGIARFLMLDETLASLDHEYIIGVGVLLKELSEKMNMDILLATFNASASEADTVLRARLNKKTNELSITTQGGKGEKTA